MFIVNKKIKKFLEMIDVRLQEKNLKTVVELYKFKLIKRLKKLKLIHQ